MLIWGASNLKSNFPRYTQALIFEAFDRKFLISMKGNFQISKLNDFKKIFRVRALRKQVVDKKTVGRAVFRGAMAWLRNDGIQVLLEVVFGS